MNNVWSKKQENKHRIRYKVNAFSSTFYIHVVVNMETNTHKNKEISSIQNTFFKAHFIHVHTLKLAATVTSRDTQASVGGGGFPVSPRKETLPDLPSPLTRIICTPNLGAERGGAAGVHQVAFLLSGSAPVFPG